MKKVIFLCTMIAIVIVLAGVRPTTVDANEMCGLIMVLLFVTPIAIVSYDLIADYIRKIREEKARMEKEAEIEYLTKKYSHLADDLSAWMGDAAIIVRWCKYSSRFSVSYEHTGKRLCVRDSIDCNGIGDEIFFSINGFKNAFLCKEHEEKFWDIVHILTKRIDDVNYDK